MTWKRYDRPPTLRIPEGVLLIRRHGNCTMPVWLQRKIAPRRRYDVHFDAGRKLIGLRPSKTGQFVIPQFSAQGVLRKLGMDLEQAERNYFPCEWSGADKMWVVDMNNGTRDFWVAARKFSTPADVAEARHRMKKARPEGKG